MSRSLSEVSAALGRALAIRVAARSPAKKR
jgi:hypothetical protein